MECSSCIARPVPVSFKLSFADEYEYFIGMVSILTLGLVALGTYVRTGHMHYYVSVHKKNREIRHTSVKSTVRGDILPSCISRA